MYNFKYYLQGGSVDAMLQGTLSTIFTSKVKFDRALFQIKKLFSGVFWPKRGLIFKNSSRASTYIGLADIFVANSVKIDRLVFSTALSKDKQTEYSHLVEITFRAQGTPKHEMAWGPFEVPHEILSPVCSTISNTIFLQSLYRVLFLSLGM